MIIKYPLEELPNPKRTKLKFDEKIKRISIELATFINDPDAQIKIIRNNSMLTVESDLLLGEEIIKAISKCLYGLDFSTDVRVIKSTF